MKVLIVYDSKFGNTEKVAQAIAAGLDAKGDSRLVRVDMVKPEDLEGLDALIVGSPVHAWGPTTKIKSFLKGLKPDALSGVKAVAFDTGYKTRVAGSATKKIEKMLKKAGCSMTVPGEKFIVTGNKGPLAEGELDKASAWAKNIL
jgi:flavodoxin I